MKRTLTVLAIAATAVLAGCSTSQSVMTGSQSKTYKLTTVCLKTHGGKSEDMDQRITHSLENNNVKVIDAPCNSANPAPDATVSYNDTWWWDVIMYLKNVDIQIHAPSGDLIASGRWDNSAVHQFASADGVVDGLIDQMLAEAAAPGSVRTTKQASK